MDFFLFFRILYYYRLSVFCIVYGKINKNMTNYSMFLYFSEYENYTLRQVSEVAFLSHGSCGLQV